MGCKADESQVLTICNISILHYTGSLQRCMASEYRIEGTLDRAAHCQLVLGLSRLQDAAPKAHGQLSVSCTSFSTPAWSTSWSQTWLKALHEHNFSRQE